VGYTSSSLSESKKKRKTDDNLDKSLYYKMIAKKDEQELACKDILPWFEALLDHEKSISLTIIDT
jgi:hypothetical protein